MNIRTAESQYEKDELDELLWRVLWKPLNLPREIRSEVALAGEKLEIVAVASKEVVGGLVAYRTDENELEIRHLAVDINYQRKSIGTNLMSRLFETVGSDGGVRIQAYVREGSYPFFVRQGFAAADEQWLEHPAFAEHGIRFKLVEKYV
jgi:N-acetylglutamate synthase-like GNAT family acetyltransferase